MSALYARIMPCLDMKDGRVVKGVQFVNLRDAGDPVACARAYGEAGADALALLDITATVEGRATLLDVVRSVAREISVPFTVGGGIRTVAEAGAVLEAGATAVSVSSAAFRAPPVLADMVREFGSARITAAVDVAASPAQPSGYEVYIDGGRTATGADAVEWVRRLDGIGVGTLLPTSKTTDGMRTGYDLPLLRALKAATSVPLVASGGAGRPEHFLDAARAGASILLAASVFHFGLIRIPALKAYLRANGVDVPSGGPAAPAR